LKAIINQTLKIQEELGSSCTVTQPIDLLQTERSRELNY